jgi:PAP2 superfamily
MTDPSTTIVDKSRGQARWGASRILSQFRTTRGLGKMVAQASACDAASMRSSELTRPPGALRLERALMAASWAVIALVIPIPVIIAVHSGLYDSFVDNPLSGWGMWGAFAIYAATRPGRKELAVTVSLAVTLRIVYDIAFGERGYPGSLVLAMGTFLGPASVPVLAVQSLRSPSQRRALCRDSLAVIALLSYIGVCLGFYVSFARLALPRKLDYFLYRFDGSLGFQPSFAAARLVHAVPPLYWLEATVYDSLGFWFALIYAVYSYYRQRGRISILKLFIANALIGFSLYFLFPAMGPKYAFPSFPALPGTVPAAAALLTGIPNAMPSLHFGGTLLICWLSRPWKWLYRITAVFAALTALATLGLGEHYLIDLVVAVPYALAILAFSATTPERRPLIVASALVFGWMLYLRTGWFFAPLSWVLVLGTVAVVLTLKRRLPVYY